MGQRSLIYSAVARGTVVLAEYTEFTGNFADIALQCLQKLPATSNKFTYSTDGHTFNYLSHNGFTYCVVAVESISRQVAVGFLERIMEDFTNRFDARRTAVAPPNSFNKDFGPKLKEHMKYCVEHQEEISKLAKVKAQVSQVQQVMRENIDQVLNRQVKIDVLVDQTNSLHNQAQGFRDNGDQIRRKMWFQNMKIKLIILGIIIAFILIVILSICRGFSCS